MQFKATSEARRKRLSIVRAADPMGHDAPTLADAVRSGLAARSKSLPWQYFYDQEGSTLFEAICALPEYYLTRTEDAILREHAGEMVAGWAQELAMVELGSGSASKTRRLISAALGQYARLHYVPIDVSESALVESAQTLVRQFPALWVTGYVANYRDALAAVVESVPAPRLWVFLGSSLGNYETEEAVELLGQVAASMDQDDRLLLGTDLAKDRATLEAAYDDAAGVTARFNLNLLERINRELGADFDVARFAHRAVYRPERGRVEMHLVSREDQVVRIPGASLSVRFAEGESIHTENSHKYTPEALRDLARHSGFVEEQVWTDDRGLFRVQRWRLCD